MNPKASHRAAAEGDESNISEAKGWLGRYAHKINHENLARLQQNLKQVDHTLRAQAGERPLVMVGAGFALGLFMGTRLGWWATRTAVRVGWASLKGSLAVSASDAVREAFPAAKA